MVLWYLWLPEYVSSKIRTYCTIVVVLVVVFVVVEVVEVLVVVKVVV